MDAFANSEIKDSSSPYYIHPDDDNICHSQPIISEVLDGTNYDLWSEAITKALQRKNKFVFLDGTINKPDFNDPLYPPWERCNQVLISWFLRTISAVIFDSIVFNENDYINDASVIWKILKDRYSHGSFVRMYQLYSDLFSLKQGDYSVSAYNTKLQKLLDELYVFRPLLNCSFSGESGICEAYKSLVDNKENEYILFFLRGLNNSYDGIRSRIIRTKPMILSAEVYNMIRIEEEYRLCHLQSENNSGSKSENSSRGSNSDFIISI